MNTLTLEEKLREIEVLEKRYGFLGVGACVQSGHWLTATASVDFVIDFLTSAADLVALLPSRAV
ncbi:MAG: hypothetical protein RL150_556 [Candidatus Parcubacteria bacterium]|jgi:hypothetical protein